MRTRKSNASQDVSEQAQRAENEEHEQRSSVLQKAFGSAWEQECRVRRQVGQGMVVLICFAARVSQSAGPALDGSEGTCTCMAQPNGTSQLQRQRSHQKKPWPNASGPHPPASGRIARLGFQISRFEGRGRRREQFASRLCSNTSPYRFLLHPGLPLPFETVWNSAWIQTNRASKSSPLSGSV